MKTRLLLAITLLGPISPVVAQNIRSGEIVRRHCSNKSGYAEVTLFENGTLRLRQEQSEEERFELAELAPEDLQAFLNRIRDEDLSEVEPGGYPEMSGDLVEECEIVLSLDLDEPITYRYGSFDSLSLGLARLNGIVDDMSLYIDENAPTVGLPHDYRPQRGDILARTDGELFEIIGLTGDKKGVELLGVDQPLTLFIPLESIRETFISLEKRRQWH